MSKRRYACTEALCPRRSFTEETDQLPAAGEGDAAAGRAGDHGLSGRAARGVPGLSCDVLVAPRG
ncbi:hypothetical protein [Ornithinimicrobium kibberense]|uniref:hypothetical protein n=1 Tax=Ornithinimicrobium kibberense TaxID=282060 RepID=UPI00362295BB